MSEPTTEAGPWTVESDGDDRHVLSAPGDNGTVVLYGDRKYADMLVSAAIAEARAAQPLTLDVERVMDAEHRWCVQVDGDYALRHEVEAHRKHAEHIVATLDRL